jgi:23S rRNA maturation mini-RNase III
MGDWVVLKNEGDAVRETYVRKSVASKCREELSHQSPHDRTVR